MDALHIIRDLLDTDVIGLRLRGYQWEVVAPGGSEGAVHFAPLQGRFKALGADS